MAQDVLRLTGRQAQDYLIGWSSTANTIRNLIRIEGREFAVGHVWSALYCFKLRAGLTIAEIGSRDALKVALGEE